MKTMACCRPVSPSRYWRWPTAVFVLFSGFCRKSGQVTMVQRMFVCRTIVKKEDGSLSSCRRTPSTLRRVSWRCRWAGNMRNAITGIGFGFLFPTDWRIRRFRKSASVPCITDGILRFSIATYRTQNRWKPCQTVSWLLTWGWTIWPPALPIRGRRSSWTVVNSNLSTSIGINEKPDSKALPPSRARRQRTSSVS